MTTTTPCTVLKPLAGPAARLLGICLAVSLTCCSYLETQRSRTVPPDDRIVLGWQERRLLSDRETRRYRCDSPLVLICDRGGGTASSCTCGSL